MSLCSDKFSEPYRVITRLRREGEIAPYDLRVECGVGPASSHGDAEEWSAFSYETVGAILNVSATFSSALGTYPQQDDRFDAATIITMDDPEHSPRRKSVSSAFSRAASADPPSARFQHTRAS